MRVIAIHAHPDDEALLTGGILAQTARNGICVEVIFATSGEQGDRHGLCGMTNTELACFREEEAAQSAARLGVHRCHFLRFPDSGWKASALHGRVDCLKRRSARDVAARAALAFGPHPIAILLVPDAGGTYGHPDHVKVFEAARFLSRDPRVKAVATASLNRQHLLHVLRPSSTARAFVERRPLFGLSSKAIGLMADVRSEAEVKREAMLAHRSQLRPGSILQVLASLPSDDFRRALGLEWLTLLGKCYLPPSVLERLHLRTTVISTSV